MSDNIDISAKIKVNDQASAAIGQVRSAMQGLQDKAKALSQSFQNLGTMKNVGGAFKNLGSSIGQVGGRLMSLAKPIAALAGIGGGIGMADAVAGMENYVTQVKELSRAAPTLGTTVEHLSGLQYAASRVGISGDQMTSALSRANSMIGRAATGKGNQLTTLFQKIGINLRDANGNIRTSTSILPQFANAIARQKDPVVQLRMATELFGRAAGPEMLRLLNQGEAGIAAFIQQAEELGLVIGPEQEQEALAFAKAQGEVRQVWQSLSRTLSQNLLPLLKPLIELFRDLLKENKTEIVNALTQAFKGLSEWLQKIDWKETVKDIKAWGETINTVVGYLGGWEVVLGTVALAMTGLLGPLINVALAFGKLAITLGALAFANPLIAIIVIAVAALAYGAYLLWKHWDKVSTWFANLWKETKRLFWEAVGWLSDFVGQFIPEPLKQAWEPIKQFFTDLWNDPKKAFWDAVAWLTNFVTQFIPQPIRDAWKAVTGFFATLWKDVREDFNAIAAWLPNWLASFIPQPLITAWKAVSKFFEDLWDDIEDAFDSAWKFIKPIIDALKNAIGWITNNMPSISGIGETIAGWGKGAASFFGFGGGDKKPAAGLPTQAQQSIVQQAATAPATRIDGEVGVEIHMTGDVPPGTTLRTRERGRVRATGDVGVSMAPA